MRDIIVLHVPLFSKGNNFNNYDNRLGGNVYFVYLFFLWRIGIISKEIFAYLKTK